MKSEKRESLRKVWGVLTVPPFIFLIITLGTTIYWGMMSQGDPVAIAENVPRSIPVVLLLTQITMLLFLFAVLRKDRLTFANIGWQLPEGQRLWGEILLGGLLGVVIGVLYPYILSPIVVFLQTNVGDYIPPGEIQPALGSQLVPFFVANVILAPFVEENIYRAYAITRLRSRYTQGAVVLITSVFFGFLHWAGGVWYMLLTGGFLGVILASLYFWRKGIMAAFMLHLGLNLVEFLFAFQG